MFSNCIQTRGCLTFTVYYCNEGYCLPWRPVLFETFILPSANFEVQLAKQTLWWGGMHLYHSELYFYIKLTDCRHFFITCLYIRLQFKLFSTKCWDFFIIFSILKIIFWSDIRKQGTGGQKEFFAKILAWIFGCQFLMMLCLPYEQSLYCIICNPAQ